MNLEFNNLHVSKTRNSKRLRGGWALSKLISSVADIAPGAFDLSPVIVHYLTCDGKLFSVRCESANVLKFAWHDELALTKRHVVLKVSIVDPARLHGQFTLTGALALNERALITVATLCRLLHLTVGHVVLPLALEDSTCFHE